MEKLLPFAVIGRLILTVGAFAQETPSAEELLEKMKVSFECDGPTLTITGDTVVYEGNTVHGNSWEVWSRDKDTFRAEESTGSTVVIWTKDKVVIYAPPGNVALVIPKETIEKAGDDLQEWLAAAQIELPATGLNLVREIDDETGEWTMRYEGEWSVVDRDALGEILVDWPAADELEFGEECWVVTLSPDGREA